MSGFQEFLQYESYPLAHRENYLHPSSLSFSLSELLSGYFKGRGYKWRPNPGEICHQRREKTERDAWKIRKEREIKKQSPRCSPAAGILGFKRQIVVGKWREEPMCCSVRGGNTISIVQSPVVNGTAREISPLSPEEHLRKEHQRVFQVSARPQCL